MSAVLRKRLRALGRFVLVGTSVGVAVGVLILLIEGGPAPPHMMRGGAAGLLIGGAVGIGEEFLFIGRRIWRSYRRVTVLRIFSYMLVVFMTLIMVNGTAAWLATDATLLDSATAYLRGSTITRDLILALLVAVVGTSFLEIRRLHNPGDIRGFLIGRYRFPVEETRVFLFADLVGSTGLAERLGPHAYSRLLGDCFRDMAEAILAWKGRVYQYVGDEVIVSWPFEEGVSDAACVECFFGMQDLLAARHERYMRIYGCVPRFRAGIHGGRVVTTWVGLAKTELAFHGDALNAAARIQSLCKTHAVDCLLSEPVLDRLSLPESFDAESLGQAELDGKEEAMEVFAVRLADARVK